MPNYKNIKINENKNDSYDEKIEKSFECTDSINESKL